MPQIGGALNLNLAFKDPRACIPRRKITSIDGDRDVFSNGVASARSLVSGPKLITKTRRIDCTATSERWEKGMLNVVGLVYGQVLIAATR